MNEELINDICGVALMEIISSIVIEPDSCALCIMIIFPVKKVSLKMWVRIIAIWTLVALSMATQVYLNTRFTNPAALWSLTFLKQLPAWYLCALLTVVIMFFYDRYPLDSTHWKKNLFRQGVIALLILSVFSHFRLWAMAYIVGRDITKFGFSEYMNYYLSQIAWDLAIYILITVGIFADRTNTTRRKNEQYASGIQLRNKELENLLNTAHLEALKLQLSPHFLFNTLNTVNALIRSNDNSKAIQVNTKLGDFLRATLYSKHELVTVEEELEFIDLYLGIELLRFNDRLIVNKKLDAATLHVLIPHFILLPLVENAVKHGIAKSSSAKCITVITRARDGQLQIEILNEGPLLESHWRIEDSEGIGLKNVSNRLEKIYNGKSWVSLRNDPKKNGVSVTISIPWQ
jgi:signal transduction histidine kinase